MTNAERNLLEATAAVVFRLLTVSPSREQVDLEAMRQMLQAFDRIATEAPNSPLGRACRLPDSSHEAGHG